MIANENGDGGEDDATYIANEDGDEGDDDATFASEYCEDEIMSCVCEDDATYIANEDCDGGEDGGGGEDDATFASEYCEDEIISCGRSVQLLAIRANFCIRAIKAWDSKTYRRIYRAPRARRQCRANFRIRAINAALLRAGTPRDPTKLDIVWRRPALRTSR